MNARRARVAEAMKQNLAEMIARDLQDPRVEEAGLVTVGQVDLNRDMSVAWVYVSCFGAGERAADSAIEALRQAAGRLRGPLARRMHLKRAPELRFVRDRGPDLRERIEEIVREDEERRDDDQDD